MTFGLSGKLHMAALRDLHTTTIGMWIYAHLEEGPGKETSQNPSISGKNTWPRILPVVLRKAESFEASKWYIQLEEQSWTGRPCCLFLNNKNIKRSKQELWWQP